MEPEQVTRELCYRCLRAQDVCFCAQIRPFEANPLFVILMHPKERRKRIGTGRMAHLCISNSRLFEGVNFTDDARVNALLADDRYFHMVLYPGPTAIQANHSEALRDSIPPGRQPLVFVLDSTWIGARTMARLNTRLHTLPRLSFSTARQSAYRFRKQPFPEAFSTIEAIHFVIGAFAAASEDSPGEAFENAPGAASTRSGAPHENLLEVFDWMVEKQCSYREPGTAHAVRGMRTRKT